MPFPLAKIGDPVVFFDGTQKLPALVTSDDQGDGIVAMNVNPGQPGGEVVIRVAPYDDTTTRADSWNWVSVGGGTSYVQLDGTPGTVLPLSSTQVALQSYQGRLRVQEGSGITDRWQYITKEVGYYDIRDWGAIPGPSGKTATTAALNAIFADISWGYFPTVTGKLFAEIYVPALQEESWYVGDLDPYTGNPAASILFAGDSPSGRGGVAGSTIVYDGTLNGTFFDFIAINGSYFENITFNGQRKARTVVHLRQYWNGAHSFLVGASGIRFHNCYFVEPENDYATALVRVGKDDDNPNTLQTDTIRFTSCFFQGIDLGVGTKQGWGVKAEVGGNTKDFYFQDCVFGQLYRGIDTLSGNLFISGIEASNIGYDRDSDAAVVFADNVPVTIQSGYMENGTAGYFARFLNLGQGCSGVVTSIFSAGTTPADDYMFKLAGDVTLQGCEIQNSRATANALPWTALTPILVGQQRLNDTNKWYVCTVAGTTGNAGGPTGTGSGIIDGSVHWDWVATGDANVAKVQLAQAEESGNGSGVIESCHFPYVTTPITEVPVYDGSGNLLGAALGNNNTDFAKGTSHLLFCRASRTGLLGSNINVALPDFDGRNVINQRDQMWTDGLESGITVVRNDNGVYTATIPAAVVAAHGVAGISLGQLPAGYRLAETIINVTTLFSGPAVTGIKASIGTQDTAADALLLAGAIDATGQLGIASADRGTAWDADRYIVPFASTFPFLKVYITVTGGAVADINAGSMTVTIVSARLLGGY